MLAARRSRAAAGRGPRPAAHRGRAARAQVVKSIAQPQRIRRAGGHNHEYVLPWQAVNGARAPVPFNASLGEAPSTHAPPTLAALRLHHYRTKSRAHARWRFRRDQAFRLNDFDSEDIYPSSPAAQAEWLARWDTNEARTPSIAWRACKASGPGRAVGPRVRLVRGEERGVSD